jgi:hypothetical protein
MESSRDYSAQFELAEKKKLLAELFFVYTQLSKLQAEFRKSAPGYGSNLQYKKNRQFLQVDESDFNTDQLKKRIEEAKALIEPSTLEITKLKEQSASKVYKSPRSYKRYTGNN